MTGAHFVKDISQNWKIDLLNLHFSPKFSTLKIWCSIVFFHLAKSFGEAAQLIVYLYEAHCW